MMQKIGVIGLGRMGSALAARLAEQGADVAGWTRSGLSAAGADALGITCADSVLELAASSDVLISSLYDDAAVADVLDTIAPVATDTLIIDTSTIVPSILTERAPGFAVNGAALVDAPIAGGPEMVTAGTCGMFVGADGETAERAVAVLKQITDKVVHVGPLGSGQVMKTINNSMLQAYFAGLTEQVRLAKRAGLSLEMVLRVLGAGPAGLPMVNARIPKILGEDTSVGFTVNGILKDIRVFQRIAAEHDVDVPSMKLAEAMELRGVEHGLGEADPAALIAHAYANA